MTDDDFINGNKYHHSNKNKSICRYCISVIAIIIILFIIIISIVLGIFIGIEKQNDTYFNEHSEKLIDYMNPYNIKKIENEIIKSYDGFNISFNTFYKLPNYALYVLNPVDKNCRSKFYEDFDINTHKIDAFQHTDYDRGHLVPQGDTHNCSSTYNMINIVPQLVCFNRGIWNVLEKDIRFKFINYTILTAVDYNINESIINNDELINYNPDNNDDVLYIPTGFYKIVFNNNNQIIYKIYLEHNKNSCYKKYNEIGDFNKLPYFMQKN